jgi:CBS domain-containing protein
MRFPWTRFPWTHADSAATVGERMSAGVAPVTPDTTLVEAAQKMRASGVGGVLVLDHRGAECAAILTERDIVTRVLAEGRDPRSVFARDIATLHPVTCGPVERIDTVAARMREHEVQHLPVVDGEEIVGMISLADIVFGRPDEERGMFMPRRRGARSRLNRGAGPYAHSG